ncbi:ATP-binding protein [Paraburkholderia sp.]|uniref:ATP-binding protein n=1 Tax=Paraburkholderia sp. TaxID=1926495 RepID=UPI00239EEBBD|nr:ATP-binding protein [Paraburkholderia sp.]MDE1179936.1 ATP-binding protein [Paraburkholderia sp.]
MDDTPISGIPIYARGAMADRVRTHHWHTTPLGPIERWPASLRVAANMVLASNFPGCLAVGRELTMIYNDAFVPILGRKPFALGRSFRDVWAEAWDVIGPIAERTLAGESTFIEDFPLEVIRYGVVEQTYFTFCYSPVFDEHGNVTGLLDTVVETTAKVFAERKLQAFAAALEDEVKARTADRNRMWRLSVDAMVVIGPEGRLQSVNPAFLSLLGWSEADVIERRIVDLVHRDDWPKFGAGQLSRKDNEVSFRVESRVLRKDGGYTTIDWTGAQRDGVTLAIGRDTTADRETAEALRQAELALQQAQKMEAIGRLTGGVAHDFNNLLQVISGNLQLLPREVAGNARATQRMDNALVAVDRGAKLASYLLAFSRRQALEPKVVNVGRALTAMHDMLGRTLGEAFEIEIRIADGLWNTFVDTAQVENAVLNLCINARDAMDGSGTLSIHVDNVELDADFARNEQDVLPGHYVRLSVSDTGCGMSPDVVSQAFEPFFTTKPEGKGSGLGLSMVFGFVKQSCGHVTIDSDVGRGTTVSVYLPRSLDIEAQVAPGALQAVTGGSETILVIEDDEGVQSVVVEMLKELGYRVLKAGNASSGLAIVESGIPVDLLFTDVVMPGPLRSTELAARARERLPEIGVLFTSGYTQEAIVHGGRLDQGVELLVKPYTREALARKVRFVLENRR